MSVLVVHVGDYFRSQVNRICTAGAACIGHLALTIVKLTEFQLHLLRASRLGLSCAEMLLSYGHKFVDFWFSNAVHMAPRFVTKMLLYSWCTTKPCYTTDVDIVQHL